MKYLLSFYSIHGIDGEEELDRASADYFSKKKAAPPPQPKPEVGQIEANNLQKPQDDDLYYNVEMDDIKTGLSYMFRDEIARTDVIEGNNYKILKNWVSVLAKVISKLSLILILIFFNQ